eukprot:4597059-Karenia_brevis.AAC.1
MLPTGLHPTHSLMLLSQGKSLKLYHPFEPDGEIPQTAIQGYAMELADHSMVKKYRAKESPPPTVIEKSWLMKA